MNLISTSFIDSTDRKQWENLYQEYAKFYKRPMTPEILNTVWSWITDSDNPFYGIGAKNEAKELIAIAHCRAMPSPLRGEIVGFLDDLYVHSNHRQSGCVQALYAALTRLAKEKNWAFIRWITAEDNYRARASYDKIAKKTNWQTYQMDIEQK